LPVSSGDKLCPICDSPLQPGSKKCGFCGTDLSIFDIDIEPLKKSPEPVAPKPKASVESRVEEVLSRPAVQERATIRETPPVVSAQPPKIEPPKTAPVPEVKKAAEPSPEPEPELAEAIEYFECPQCGATVETAANSCPKCGVLFAEEGAEMFECPACNTLVSLDAKSCPGCGAIFIEPEEAAKQTAEPAIAQKDLEPPLAEVKVPSRKPEKAPPEPSKEGDEKKGFMGFFKRKKEAEPAPEPERPVAKERVLQAPAVPAPPYQKPAEPRVREIRAAETAPVVRPAPSPAAKDKGRDLARMVAEMKPLLALAREKEVDIGESKQLIDDAAIAGRERQIDKAIDLVQKSKTVLMSRLDSDLSQLINRLNDEIKVAREFGGDISRPTTYIQEVARARAAGDVEAAYVYADKVSKELLPITGRYNEFKKKLADLRDLIVDCEVFIVDTKEARRLLVDATRAFEQKEFDKVDSHIKAATDSLYKTIPVRMNEEMNKAKEALRDAKVRNVNITPMLTTLKSSVNMLKSGDYAHAIKEMREFREMMKKAA
jgi:RNA polymerase subunit RPABC4/transcription elongation factor Spt4